MMVLIDEFPATAVPAEAEALRGEVKASLSERLVGMSGQERARTWTGFDRSFSCALAERGWLGLTLPRQYGGAVLDAFARLVLVEELLAAGAPIATHWIGDRQSGPLLLRYGTEAQRQDFLPRICRGEIVFCFGMSEPNAGSDLASVRTRAVPDGGGWRLNGSNAAGNLRALALGRLAAVRPEAFDQADPVAQMAARLAAVGGVLESRTGPCLQTIRMRTTLRRTGPLLRRFPESRGIAAFAIPENSCGPWRLGSQKSWRTRTSTKSRACNPIPAFARPWPSSSKAISG